MKKKKHLLAVALVAVVGLGLQSAFAWESDGRDKSGWKEHLTEQQKECLKRHECPKHEGMTREEKKADAAFRECKKKAFEACGIEKPAHKNGENGKKSKM